MQRELDDLEDWNNSKEMKPSTEKCKVTSLRSNKNFHYRDSPSVDDKGEKNTWIIHGTRSEKGMHTFTYPRRSFFQEKVNMPGTVASYRLFWSPCS